VYVLTRQRIESRKDELKGQRLTFVADRHLAWPLACGVGLEGVVGGVTFPTGTDFWIEHKRRSTQESPSHLVSNLISYISCRILKRSSLQDHPVTRSHIPGTTPQSDDSSRGLSRRFVACLLPWPRSSRLSSGRDPDRRRFAIYNKLSYMPRGITLSCQFPEWSDTTSSAIPSRSLLSRYFR